MHTITQLQHTSCLRFAVYLFSFLSSFFSERQRSQTNLSGQISLIYCAQIWCSLRPQSLHTINLQQWTKLCHTTDQHCKPTIRWQLLLEKSSFIKALKADEWWWSLSHSILNYEQFTMQYKHTITQLQHNSLVVKVHWLQTHHMHNEIQTYCSNSSLSFFSFRNRSFFTLLQ